MTAAPPDPVRRAADQRPEQVALESGEERWTYRRLDAAADEAARIARAEGVGPDDRVGVLLPRGAALLAALHGIPRTGASVAPLHRRWTDRELAGFLSRAEPALVLAGPREEEDRVAAAAPDVPVAAPPRAEESPPERASDGPVSPGPPERKAVQEHSLVPTSGSTGGPRAVRLSLANHLACARGARRRLGLGPGDRWHAALAPAHVGGLALLLRAAVVGCRVVLTGEFEARELSRLIDRGRVTHVSLVPVMLRRLLDARDGVPLPDGFRCALVGGAAVPGPLLERALALEVPVALTYGLAEAASQVATASPELVQRKPGTVGPPLPGTEVRTGADGEIQIRGPTVALGYLGEEELPSTDDGWLRTGDRGRIDDEGHLWVTGRLSERIVTGGVTVSPAEVEAALAEHPGVAEAAVVGLPDEEWGERVTAAVVPSGSDRETRGLEGRLEAHCRRRLSSPRRPRLIRLVDQLPRTPTGKPDRAALRRRMRCGGP